jgi:hypothetical protein
VRLVRHLLCDKNERGSDFCKSLSLRDLEDYGDCRSLWLEYGRQITLFLGLKISIELVFRFNAARKGKTRALDMHAGGIKDLRWGDATVAEAKNLFIQHAAVLKLDGTDWEMFCLAYERSGLNHPVQY